MKCAVCGGDFPSGKKASARYCDDGCRAEAARIRERVRRKKSQQLANRSQIEAEGQVHAARSVRRTPKSASRPAAKTSPGALSSCVTVAPVSVEVESSHRERASRNLFVSSARIDMKEQVLRLAPAHATGYRLVLPAAQDGARPKLAPRRQNGDPRSCYRVSPFEYPLDVRLRDGKWYRILWVDREGQAVNSSPELGVPSLYFFLGTPDAISLATTQYVAEVPALTRDAEDSQSVKLLTAQSVNVDTEPPTVEAERPVEAPMLSVAPTSAVAEEIPAAPAPIEAESHSLSQETAQPTPNQTEIPAVAANPFVAMTETAPIAGIGGTAQKTPMEKPPLDPFWDSIGKHATRLESLAQVLYEQRLATAKEEGRPLPSEPLTQLSRDERKDIRRAASHPFWQSLGSYLNSRFARARRKGIGAVASLKLAPTPLSDSDQRLIDEVLASPDKRRYLDYLHARRDALLVGDTLPKEPVSKLAAAQRKRLVKLVADVRPIVESLALNDEE